jgi:hypothetical protein
VHTVVNRDGHVEDAVRQILPVLPKPADAVLRGAR